MQRPKILRAFTETEFTKAHDLLAAKVAFMMGRKFEEVQEEIKRVPYKVVKASNGDAHVEVEVDGKPKAFSPPEISAMILSKPAVGRARQAPA